MDTRFKTKDEININELITEIEKWSKPVRVVNEDDIVEYYYCDGTFYKENNDLEEIMLNREQMIEELTYYRDNAKVIFVNENLCLFDLC